MTQRLKCLVIGVACLLVTLPAAAANIVTDYPITVDTYMDGQSPTYNFGVSASLKAVVNGNDGSKCHALIQMPDLTAVNPADVVSVVLRAKQSGSNTTGALTIRFQPLTHGFVEGTGSNTASGDGATWGTYDGTRAWTTSGGDYTTAVYADPTESSTWWTWDITSFWNNSSLVANGGILILNDESDPGVGNMPRCVFYSSDGTTGSTPYIEVTTVPEPASLVTLGLGALVGLVRRRHRG